MDMSKKKRVKEQFCSHKYYAGKLRDSTPTPRSSHFVRPHRFLMVMFRSKVRNACTMVSIKSPLTIKLEAAKYQFSNSSGSNNKTILRQQIFSMGRHSTHHKLYRHCQPTYTCGPKISAEMCHSETIDTIKLCEVSLNFLQQNIKISTQQSTLLY